MPHSANFRSRTDSLIPEEEWERDREKFCTAFGLEVDPQVAIARQMALLNDGLQRVKEGLANGLLEIDEQACVRLPALNAMAEDNAVVAYQQSIPIVKLWSDGTKASADMMAMDTTRHLGIARTDPRRKTPAAGIYTHVLGSYPVFYDQPIVLLTRQGGPAVEGVEQYNSSSEERIKIQLLAVDTHGYTYGAMALAKHLRFVNFRGIMSFSIEKYAGVLLSKMEEETPAEARRRKLRRLPQMS
ncbi:MAG: hypothetical protein EON93_16620 [Burkholderiales bacterium]|nr:MAG: hypothetical protein EON93_16620 [Burkholderiales bacterium]